MWGHSEKTAIYKPGRGSSPGTESVSTLILDFQPPEFWENKFLLFKPPSLWYFVMAAQAKTQGLFKRTRDGNLRVTVLSGEGHGSFREEVTLEVSLNESVLHSAMCCEEYKRFRSTHPCLEYLALHSRRQCYHALENVSSLDKFEFHVHWSNACHLDSLELRKSQSHPPPSRNHPELVLLIAFLLYFPFPESILQ